VILGVFPCQEFFFFSAPPQFRWIGGFFLNDVISVFSVPRSYHFLVPNFFWYHFLILCWFRQVVFFFCRPHSSPQLGGTTSDWLRFRRHQGCFVIQRSVPAFPIFFKVLTTLLAHLDFVTQNVPTCLKVWHAHLVLQFFPSPVPRPPRDSSGFVAMYRRSKFLLSLFSNSSCQSDLCCVPRPNSASCSVFVFPPTSDHCNVLADNRAFRTFLSNPV